MALIDLHFEHRISGSCMGQVQSKKIQDEAVVVHQARDDGVLDNGENPLERAQFLGHSCFGDRDIMTCQ